MEGHSGIGMAGHEKKMARSDLRGKESGKDVGKVEERRMDDTFRDAGQKGHFHTRKWVEE